MNPLSHYLGSQIPRQTSFVSHSVDLPRRPGAPRLLPALIAAALLALTALALPSGALAAPIRADHFAVTVSPRPVNAGDDFTITTTAKDASNATIKDYSDDIQFSDSAGQLSAAAPGKWINGVSKTTASVKTAAAGDVVTVQTANGTSGQSSAFNVAGSLDHFAVAVSPRPAIAGQDIKITATAKDVNNTTVTGYAGKPDVYDDSQTMSVSDQGSFAGGVSTSTASVPNVLHGDVVYVKDAATGAAGQSAAFNVTGAVDHLSLSVQSSPRTGMFDPAGPVQVTARALDAAGNTVTGYSGPATWSDSAGLLSPSAPSDFVAGVSRTTANASSPVHGDVLTLASGGNSIQRKFNVVGPLDHFDAHVPSSANVGDPFSLTVYARDAAGNVFTSYAGFSDFYYDEESNFVNLAPFHNGVSKSTVTWSVPAHQLLIPVTDLMPASINPIDIIGPPATPVRTFERTDHSTSCASIKGTLTLKMQDAAGNTLTGYNADPWEGLDSWFLHDTPVAPGKPAPYVRGVSRTRLSIVNSDGRTQDWMLVLDGSSDFMQIC
jgi:hypothetical protein